MLRAQALRKMLSDEIIALYPTHCCNPSYFDDFVSAVGPKLKVVKNAPIRHVHKYASLGIVVTNMSSVMIPFGRHIIKSISVYTWSSHCYKGKRTTTSPPHNFGCLSEYLPKVLISIVDNYAQEVIQDEEVCLMPYYWNSPRDIQMSKTYLARKAIEDAYLRNVNLDNIPLIEMRNSPETFRLTLLSRGCEQKEALEIATFIMMQAHQHP